MHGFDTKWDEVRLSMTKVLDEDILENCFLHEQLQYSEGIVLAGTAQEWERGQLLSTVRHGSPVFRAEKKGH